MTTYVMLLVVTLLAGGGILGVLYQVLSRAERRDVRSRSERRDQRR